MTPGEVFLLFGGGLLAGTVNAIAGGGSLITFPLLVGLGLPGVAANVSNALSVAPGYAASAVGSRPDLVGQGRRILRIIPTVIAGTLCGSALLLFTPRSVFDVVVPFLLLGTALMMAFQNRLRALAGHPKDNSPRKAALLTPLAVFLCGLYGGYFNAAMGVLLIAALALVLDEPLRRISALKNVFSAVVGATTVLLYSAFGPVNWAVVAVLAPATIVGGFVGARIARRLPSEVLRWTIVVFAATVAVVLFLT
ncbi:sulfite exporter TauE/SafE family protein [Actinoplanes awajinensis]|uniref:Probable membrane transporter protein n=1 Tax=Actinoplanes awajinensis subsp. mycoplanecinus TaxID=135947 RepID=A0A0X3V5Z2_9ACTN|nr:sulfite exporter TauE/SafE family protein [Actinoplanes awajinensis]KUL40054.1 permease [Actinoplanes awajinensis subsp. mycoplanecinus]